MRCFEEIQQFEKIIQKFLLRILIKMKITDCIPKAYSPFQDEKAVFEKFQVRKINALWKYFKKKLTFS